MILRAVILQTILFRSPKRVREFAYLVGVCCSRERDAKRNASTLEPQEGSMNAWSYVGLIGLLVCLGLVHATSSREEDERTIRGMVDQAIARLNRGDVSAFADFWDEDADYVGVDGKLTKGRSQIQTLFREMGKTGAGQQSATIQQIRFITTELATVDGVWTVTGARDTTGKELPVIRGRGFELVQKKNGIWKFVATREMVIFGGS